MLTMFPLVTYFGVCILCIFWMIIQALLMSAGTISTSSLVDAASNVTQTSSGGNLTLVSEIKEIQSLNIVRYLYAYHVFGLLWMNAFIQGVSIVTVSSAISRWYWTPLTAKTAMGKFPICASYANTFRHHLGTVGN